MDIVNETGLKIGPENGLIFSITSPIVRQFDCLFNRSLKNIAPIDIIRLEESAVAKQSNVQTISKKHILFVERKIKELLDAGVIEESCSPRRHSQVIVPKKNGDYRLAINYKPVNNVTIFDSYPLPKIDDLISRLGAAKIFSSLDFSQFYHQIPLSMSDREKTAFCALGRLYQFNRVPFGLKNAVALCCRIMNQVLDNIPNVLVYLNDVLVFGESVESHNETLKLVLQRMYDYGLSLNLDKCKFKIDKVHFLGYKVFNGSVRPDPDRLRQILSFPLPNSAKSLQRFLGMSNYYSKYIDNFSSISKWLYAKLSNFDEYSKKETDSYNNIKDLISRAVLFIPSDSDEIVLRTDASNESIAAVLETSLGKPIYFCSRVLQDHEKRLDIVEWEALSIYWGINRLRSFLLGRKFLVISDHKPLEFIFNNNKHSPKILRWKLSLQEFDFKVKHCKGTDNVVADCLSRVFLIENKQSLLVSEDEVKDVQFFDSETKSMIKCLNNNYKSKPSDISLSLWKVRNQLTVVDNVLFTQFNKIFVPFSLRKKILAVAHGNHNGEKLTVSRLRPNFFGHY